MNTPPILCATISENLITGTIRVCSWCRPGITDAVQLNPDWIGLGLEITHGICRDCREKQLAQFNTSPVLRVMAESKVAA